jgi:hypothetical protein
MLDELRKSVHDLTADIEETTPVPGQSLDPGELICRPVLAERARRKSVDDDTNRRLVILARQVRVTMWLVMTMVAFASLEYLGIMGSERTPIWARAMFDGVAVFAGKLL